MTGTVDRARTDWAALNERQQTYLRTIFEHDQAAEREQSQSTSRWGSRVPAVEWRRLLFVIEHIAADPTPIQVSLKEAGIHDPGAGSTLAALGRRELLVVYNATARLEFLGRIIAVPARKVELTPRGRAAARAGAGITVPKKVTGLYSQWTFETLAKLAAAEPAGGVWMERRVEGPRHLWPPRSEAIVNLSYRPVPLAEEFSADPDTGAEVPAVLGVRREPRARLTAAGLRHYTAHYACYRDLYSDLDWVPEPDVDDRPVHESLAAHRARRPRHLLSAPAFDVLLDLLDQDRMDTESLRRLQARWSWKPPADDPLRDFVPMVGKRAKVADELIGHADGPLVRLVPLVDARGQAFLNLATLTDAGREHYRARIEEYRHTFLDLDLPDPETE